MPSAEQLANMIVQKINVAARVRSMDQTHARLPWTCAAIADTE